MEESKVDKRTKEYKTNLTQINKPEETKASYKYLVDENLWDSLKESGFPVKEAVFHRTVKSGSGEPETAFYASGAKPSRTASMWYSPCGLLCEQAKEKKVIIPLANVVYALPL